MDDMDVRVSPLAPLEAGPTQGPLWETRYGICRRLRVDSFTLRQMIRTGEIETQLIDKERVFRENQPRPASLLSGERAEDRTVLQRSSAPPPPPSQPDHIIEMLLTHLGDAQEKIGSIRSERDAMAIQIESLQALVDVQRTALQNATVLLDLQKRRPRKHGAPVIRRFGQSTDW